MNGKSSKNTTNYIPKEEATSQMREGAKYICTIDLCGYTYDSNSGDPEHGIEAGTAFENLPPDWTCPICGADKSQFAKLS